MAHPESVTAVLADNEPPDGTKLVVQQDGTYRVIVRDDASARSWNSFEGDHWFGDPQEDPMSLHQQVKYADAVYALGDKLAEFGR